MLKRIQVFIQLKLFGDSGQLKLCLKRICLSVWLILLRMIADFFNWNRVKIRYCDGASFTGDSEDKVNLQN